ncbi:MAG: cytoplasmic protein, partial [Bacteroidales bacterium]|nr:cytoplasmic protein [Bacteroidales bacterium]
MNEIEQNSRIVAPVVSKSLVEDLRQIIEQARGRVAATVNSELTLMYWHIGERINRDVLGNQRAEYGKHIVSTVSTQLQEEYGKGFEERTIRRMMQFAAMFPDLRILTPLVTKLSWSHFLIVMT